MKMCFVMLCIPVWLGSNHRDLLIRVWFLSVCMYSREFPFWIGLPICVHLFVPAVLDNDKVSPEYKMPVIFLPTLLANTERLCRALSFPQRIDSSQVVNSCLFFTCRLISSSVIEPTRYQAVSFHLDFFPFPFERAIEGQFYRSSMILALIAPRIVSRVYFLFVITPVCNVCNVD